MNRLTLQGALRYEHAWSHFPAGQGWDGPDLFHSTPQVFPEVIGGTRLRRPGRAWRWRL